MDELEATFTTEKDTKNTRRYAEDIADKPPIMGTAYIQQWALKQLGGGTMPDRIKITLETA